MKSDTTLTVEKLKELVEYNSETGVFIWIGKIYGPRKWGEPAEQYDNQGYKKIFINGKFRKAHRLAWLYVTGNWPEGQIDHINKIRDDNRFENLRDVDNFRNMQNVSVRRTNTSGHRGVCFSKKLNKWIAQISYNKKYRYLGSFTSKEEAIEARKKAELEYDCA